MSTRITLDVADFGQPITAGTGHTTIAETDATIWMTVESTAEDGTVSAVVVMMEHHQASGLARMLDEKIALARLRLFNKTQQEGQKA